MNINVWYMSVISACDLPYPCHSLPSPHLLSQHFTPPTHPHIPHTKPKCLKINIKLDERD